MKLVATSPFRAPTTVAVKCEGQVHPLHIHKGARFSIGDNLPMEKLSPLEQRVVTELNIAGRIVEASQTELVQKIDAEAANDLAVEKRQAKGLNRV